MSLLSVSIFKGGNVLKLQDDSTGASPRKTMRFRKRAARYKGKIKGPNVSRKSGRVNAGWYDGSVRLDISAVASLRARCRRLAGGTDIGLGWDMYSSGDSGGELPSLSLN